MRLRFTYILNLEYSIHYIKLWGLDTPNFYNKTKINNSITNLGLVNYYIKNQGDSLSNIYLVAY